MPPKPEENNNRGAKDYGMRRRPSAGRLPSVEGRRSNSRGRQRPSSREGAQKRRPSRERKYSREKPDSARRGYSRDRGVKENINYNNQNNYRERARNLDYYNKRGGYGNNERRRAPSAGMRYRDQNRNPRWWG